MAKINISKEWQGCGDRYDIRILEINPVLLKLSRLSQVQSEPERTLVSILFSRTPYLFILVGSIGGQRGIKMASASTPSANEPARVSL